MAVKVITDSTSCIPKRFSRKVRSRDSIFKRYNEWRKL